jgi:Zn-dependent protease
MGQAEVGRLFGIPIVLDVTFIFLFVIFGLQYFISGDSVQISYGLLLITGLALSILLHELGHAFAGRMYGIGTSHIELNGLGGLCYYDSAMPIAAIPRTVMALAGPGMNLMLWFVLGAIASYLYTLEISAGDIAGTVRFAALLDHLSSWNFVLMWFNLLPSHPLDGGTALSAMLGPVTGRERAMRWIAYSGMLVVAWLAWRAIQGDMFAAVIAFSLLMANQAVLQSTGRGPPWTRY